MKLLELSDLWSELEREAAGSSRRGILRRRLIPEATCDLFIGVERASDPVRMLLVRIGDRAVGHHRQLPEARGCELSIKHVPDDPADRLSVCLSLLDRRFADVFTSLVFDVVGCLRGLVGDEAVFNGLIARIERWQRFFNHNAPEGLSPESQRGMFGELWFLKNHLLTTINAAAAVAAWTGPRCTPHDFQLPTVSVEVKTTVAKQHIKLEIANELQLDDTHVPCLVLYHLSADTGATGLSLPDLVNEVRRAIAGQAGCEIFEDLLVEGGYLDVHAERYREPHYRPRASQFFHVRPGFPRLIDRDLLPGLGDLQYTVMLASCLGFAITDLEWSQILKGKDHE